MNTKKVPNAVMVTKGVIRDDICYAFILLVSFPNSAAFAAPLLFLISYLIEGPVPIPSLDIAMVRGAISKAATLNYLIFRCS